MLEGTAPQRGTPTAEPLVASVWAIASVVAIGALGTNLATTSVFVAFDEIGRDLGAGVGTVQWVASGYLLGLAAIIAATGWLARRVGARRLYFAALVAFTAASVLCALAPGIGELIGFRVLQGMAGGAIMPVGQMMLATAAGANRMGRVMSVIGVPIMLGPMLGPIVGGFLVETLSWHWVFLMNVPLGVAAFLLGFWLLPPMPTRAAGRFDFRGFLLMVIAGPTLIFGLAQAGSGVPLTASVTIAPIATGAALFALFVVHAWHARQPLLDLRIWTNPNFAACATTTLLVGASLFGTFLLLPLYFQTVRGASPIDTGLLLAPQGIGTALAMPIAGRLTDRTGGGRVAVVGVAILTITTVPLAFVGPATPYWLLCTVLFLRGLGTGGALMPAMAAAYATLRTHEFSDATPQLNILQRGGQAIGTAILGAILAGRLGDRSGAVALADERAAAFAETFAWAVGLSIAALVPATVLLLTERRQALRRRRELETDHLSAIF